MAIQPDFMAKLPPLTRLARPQFAPEAACVYGEALDTLDARGIRYLVGGALALNAHSGVWRDTKDLDVFLLADDARTALDALAKTGFETEVVYESWLGKAWKGEYFVDLIWRNANGLYPVESRWFERAAIVPALGRDLPALPLEELLVSKMMVMGRYRYDGADILHVIAASRQPIDWALLADLAGEHIGLLLAHLHVFCWAYPERRDRVPDEVLTRYAQLARDAKSSFGEFRGRLIDIQSFEVDVQEWGMADPHRLVLERIFGQADGRS